MSQYISTDLRQWIREQSAAGHAREQLLASMVGNGWNEDVAAQALVAVLDAGKKIDKAMPLSQAPLPPRVKVPALALEGQPLFLDAGDRKVAVLGVVKNPAIAILGGLLSDGECDALVEAARPAMKRSSVLNMHDEGSHVDDVRTSNGMFFHRGQSELLTRIEARIAHLLNWPVENGEGMQVLQYGPGAEYKPHYDYFDPREAGTPAIVKRGGQRVGTVLMYLNDPPRGGGTLFPDVGLEVGPRKGHGVFFSYDIAHPSSRTLHGGSPVLEGEKWVATKWLREREFSLKTSAA